MSEKKPDQFEVEELDEKALEGVAGGSEFLPEVDVISCKDNTTCPNNGCSSGCSPNVVAGCT